RHRHDKLPCSSPRRASAVAMPSPSVETVKEKMCRETEKSDDDQIKRHDVVEDSRYQQDQDAGNECDKWLKGDHVDRHLKAPLRVDIPVCPFQSGANLNVMPVPAPL